MKDNNKVSMQARVRLYMHGSGYPAVRVVHPLVTINKVV